MNEINYPEHKHPHRKGQRCESHLEPYVPDLKLFEPETKVVEWCPAHGYPLPCYKCGMPKGSKPVSSYNPPLNHCLPDIKAGGLLWRCYVGRLSELSVPSGYLVSSHYYSESQQGKGGLRR